MDINKLFKQLLDLYNRLNKRQKIAMIGGVVAIVAFLAFFIVFSITERNENANYAVLFDGLTPSDNALILQHLQSNNIPYKLQREDTILVPKDVVYEQRIALSSNGIPKNSKVGFEIFDEQSFGITESELAIKRTRAIEGELGRTIESLKPIISARVHIAIPKESVFVSKEVLPTASATLEIAPNMYLTPNQIEGIKNLIASAVSKLTKENVAIINQNGEPLDANNESTATNEIINLQLKYKNNFERILEDKISNVLTPIIGGKDRVVAKVNAEFDFSQTKSMKETFDPNNVVRGEQTHEERKEGVSEPEIGGVPGAVSNVGPVQGLDSLNNKQIHTINTTTTNYEVGKTISEIKGQFGTLKRLSAAVVVDGTYALVNDNGVEKMQYVALDSAKIQQIEALVKQTIGFSQERGDMVSVGNFEFNAKSGSFTPQTSLEKVMNALKPALPLLKYVLVAIIIFIFYQKIIAPFAQRMIETQEKSDEDIESLIALDEDEEISNKENELRKRIENQLGLGDFREDELKYEVLLEKIKTLLAEKPQEVANLFQTLIRDELGLEDIKKGA
ncbi:flagellar basal-body MS-ring/collar protein FliF [Helicobacter sp. 23-1044]